MTTEYIENSLLPYSLCPGLLTNNKYFQFSPAFSLDSHTSKWYPWTLYNWVHDVIFYTSNFFCSMLCRWDFLGGSDGKASAYNVGDPGSIPGSGKISWRRKWQPTPVFLPGKSHGWKSLIGYSPWDHKELDTTEWLHFVMLVRKTHIIQSLSLHVVLCYFLFNKYSNSFESGHLSCL